MTKDQTTAEAVISAQPEPVLENAETNELSDSAEADNKAKEMAEAKDEAFSALRKIGLSEKTIGLVFGLASPSEREKIRAAHDAMRKERLAAREKNLVRKQAISGFKKPVDQALFKAKNQVGKSE